MPKFNYTAQDNNGRNFKSSIIADTQEKALTILQNKGLLVLEIAPDVRLNIFDSLLKFSTGVGSKKIKGHVMAFFAEQLSTLLGGGVPLIRAISLLGEYSTDKNFGPVLIAVARDIASGNSFHGALEKFPKVFDHTWLSMVEAGEVGGHLADALLQIAKYVKSKDQLKSRIITAISYPAVLFVMAVGVLIYFVVGIVPTFASIFDEFDMELPMITQMVLAVSGAIHNHIFLIIFGIIVLCVSFYVFISTSVGRYFWHYFHLHAPLFGNFISNMFYEKLLSNMATLLTSGVSIINVLAVMEEAMQGNVIIQKAIMQVRKDVSTGKSLSESFRKTGVFPGLMTEMMLMGEESGRLPHIMVTLSSFYNEQVIQFIARFSALIDPILIVGIGSIIAVIVMSIFLPIFKLSQIGSNQ